MIQPVQRLRLFTKLYQCHRKTCRVQCAKYQLYSTRPFLVDFSSIWAMLLHQSASQKQQLLIINYSVLDFKTGWKNKIQFYFREDNIFFNITLKRSNITPSKTSFSPQWLGQILPDPTEASGLFQYLFTHPYYFCKQTKFRFSGIEVASFILTKTVSKSKKRWCVSRI